jgi:hypothetical protein
MKTSAKNLKEAVNAKRGVLPFGCRGPRLEPSHPAVRDGYKLMRIFDDFRRFPEISNQFQSLFKKLCDGRATTDWIRSMGGSRYTCCGWAPPQPPSIGGQSRPNRLPGKLRTRTRTRRSQSESNHFEGMNYEKPYKRTARVRAGPIFRFALRVKLRDIPDSHFADDL